MSAFYRILIKEKKSKSMSNHHQQFDIEKNTDEENGNHE